MKAHSHLRSAFLVFFVSGSTLFSAVAPEEGALRAFRHVPKKERQHLARAVALDAAPTPDRWHFLVHAPGSETGVKEFVVENGKMISSQETSEFATSLTEEDVVGGKAMKLDTERLFETANDYALANDVLPASMNYTLEKHSETGEPVWRVDCLDGEGAIAGSVVMKASDGEVLSHDGFPVAPSSTDSKARPQSFPSASAKLETEAEPQVAVAMSDEIEEEAEESDEDEARPARTETRRSSVKKSHASSASRPVTHRSKRPVAKKAVRAVTRPVRVLRRVLPF